MKKLPRLLNSVAILCLATLPTASVVGCRSNNQEPVTLPQQIAFDLQLVDNNGKSVVTPDLVSIASDKPEFIIQKLFGLKLNSLLNATNDHAKDEMSFNFLINDLKLKLVSGTSFTDGVFDKDLISKYTLTAANVKLKSAKLNNKTDFCIISGTYQLLINNEQNEVVATYQMLLKTGNVNDESGFLSDFYFFFTEDNFIAPEGFAVNKPFAPLKDLPVTLQGPDKDDYLQAFQSLGKLLNFSVQTCVIKINVAPEHGANFGTGDSIIIGFLIGNDVRLVNGPRVQLTL